MRSQRLAQNRDRVMISQEKMKPFEVKIDGSKEGEKWSVRWKKREGSRESKWRRRGRLD